MINRIKMRDILNPIEVNGYIREEVPTVELTSSTDLLEAVDKIIESMQQTTIVIKDVYIISITLDGFTRSVTAEIDGRYDKSKNAIGMLCAFLQCAYRSEHKVVEDLYSNLINAYKMHC